MASIKDDRGYNQGFKPTKALAIRTKRRAKSISDHFEQRKDLEILEIGCGTGELAFEIAKNTRGNVTSTDFCVPFIETAKKSYKLPNLHFFVVDSLKLKSNNNLSGKRFDYIVGNGILHHLYSDLKRVLSDANSLLKPRGKIVFFEPNIYNPYCYLIFKTQWFRKKANLEPNEMAFTKREVSEILKQSGFKNIRVSYRDFLLPNTPTPMIGFFIALGNLIEQIPLVTNVSQSILIVAQK